MIILHGQIKLNIIEIVGYLELLDGAFESLIQDSLIDFMLIAELCGGFVWYSGGGGGNCVGKPMGGCTILIGFSFITLVPIAFGSF